MGLKKNRGKMGALYFPLFLLLFIALFLLTFVFRLLFFGREPIESEIVDNLKEQLDIEIIKEISGKILTEK